MMYTRGVSIPVKMPKLSAADYYRHSIPSKEASYLMLAANVAEARQFSKIVERLARLYFGVFSTTYWNLNSLAKKLGNLIVVEKPAGIKKQTSPSLLELH